MQRVLSLILVSFATGCGSRPEVVVYSSLDKEFSGSILSGYAAANDVRVRPKYDAESTKTVGLITLIEAEASRPRCDLFWNNEVLHTLRLKKKGLLATFRPANAADYPEAYRDPDGQWYGFAARARIILVNTRLVAEADRPSSILDLAGARWKGKVGLAKPLFGTTATHAACLFAAWGDDRAKGYYRSLKANDAQILSGNKQVAQAVGSGAIAFGMTDTDDAMEEIAAGSPVAIVYPDRAEGGLGTLFIPNTLAVIKGCPHPERAEALANYLLSPEVENVLAVGPSAQIPLNPKAKAPPRVETPKTVRAMSVDFARAADLWESVAAFLLDEFGG